VLEVQRLLISSSEASSLMSEAGLFDTETTPGRRDSESPPRRDVRVWTVVIYACVVLSKKVGNEPGEIHRQEEQDARG
jgi:hypothetical protein